MTAQSAESTGQAKADFDPRFEQVLRRFSRPQGLVHRGRTGRIPGSSGAIRMRQIHGLADDCGIGKYLIWRPSDRGLRCHRRSAEVSRHCDGFSVLRALPAQDRRRKHRFSAEEWRSHRRTRWTLPFAQPRTRLSSESCWNGSRGNCRAGSVSALRWRGQLFGVRRSSLMDEPLSNLDAKLRGNMRAELKHMQSELGITTIYVTHDQIEAMTLAHRVAILKDGDPAAAGHPKGSLLRPGEFVCGRLHGVTADELRRGRDNLWGENSLDPADCRVPRSRFPAHQETPAVHLRLPPRGLPQSLPAAGARNTGRPCVHRLN